MRGFVVSFVTTSVLFISIQRWLESSMATVAAGDIAKQDETQDLPVDYIGNLDQDFIFDLEDVCSERETRVQKEQSEPEFCKPDLVHPSKLHKKRTCICADGYVRNAWDRCILENECKVCKNEPTKDYNNFCVCAYKCGQPAATKCGQDCKPGCDCPPGYSRIANGDCVSINDCPPICPGNSTFNLCFSGCEPLCRLGPRKKDCVPSCNVGNCICIQGYAMESGICYPWEQCPKN